MNKKIKKYLDEIAKTEKKIADLQQYLRGVQAALKQEEAPAVCHGLQRTFRYRSISNPYTQGRRIHERKAMDT